MLSSTDTVTRSYSIQQRATAATTTGFSSRNYHQLSKRQKHQAFI